MMSWDGSKWNRIASGPAAPFTGPSGCNHLAVVLSGRYVAAWLNGERLETMDVDTCIQKLSGTGWGYVRFVINLETGR